MKFIFCRVTRSLHDFFRLNVLKGNNVTQDKYSKFSKLKNSRSGLFLSRTSVIFAPPYSGYQHCAVMSPTCNQISRARHLTGPACSRDPVRGRCHVCQRWNLSLQYPLNARAMKQSHAVSQKVVRGTGPAVGFADKMFSQDTQWSSHRPSNRDVMEKYSKACLRYRM